MYNGRSLKKGRSLERERVLAQAPAERREVAVIETILRERGVGPDHREFLVQFLDGSKHWKNAADVGAGAIVEYEGQLVMIR